MFDFFKPPFDFDAQKTRCHTCGEVIGWSPIHTSHYFCSITCSMIFEKKQEEFRKSFEEYMKRKEDKSMSTSTLKKKKTGTYNLTKERTVEVVIILDRSGSMTSARADTIGGYNTFIEEQKKLPGKCNLTLVQFDDQYQIDYSNVDMKEVKNLTEADYVPRGLTALNDAMGKTIASVRDRISKSKKRHPKVLIMVITDGQENASREYSGTSIKQMIEELQGTGLWTFTYVGANQDAIAAAQNLGINAKNATNFDTKTVGQSFKTLSKCNALYRSAPGGQSMNYFDGATNI